MIFEEQFHVTYSYTDASGHNNGNVQRMNNDLNMEITQLYTYDSLNRLATAETLHQNQPWWSGDSPTGSCWSEQYTYDAWGNMSAISPASSNYTGCTQEMLSMTPTLKNQLQDTNGDFVYDAPGNLIQPGPIGGPYVFDAENHLISAGGKAYLYDGDGKRVGKAPASTPTRPNYLYWYGDGSQILLETDGAGNAYNQDFYFNGTIVSRSESDWVDHFFTDALGNVRVVYGDGDPDGGVSEYYPFGGERPIPACCPNNLGGVNVPFKFTGKERDSESGLDNFGARYMGSNLGRFMSPDETLVDQQPEEPQSWNLYSYVRNNPLNGTDPTGNACVSNGNGGYVDDTRGGQSCAEVDQADKKVNPQAIVTADPLPMSMRQFFGLDPAYNQIQYERDLQWHQWVKSAGANEVRAELPIGPGDIEALAELLEPAGAKMAQIIARLGKGFGNPQIAMKELTALRDAAAGMGQSATGFYIKADSTIYRVGNDYLTVAKDGKVLSYVKNATPGERVALKYSRLGGK